MRCCWHGRWLVLSLRGWSWFILHFDRHVQCGSWPVTFDRLLVPSSPQESNGGNSVPEGARKSQRGLRDGLCVVSFSSLTFCNAMTWQLEVGFRKMLLTTIKKIDQML